MDRLETLKWGNIRELGEKKRAEEPHLVVHGKNDGDGAAAAISESHPPHAIFMSPPIAAVFSAADAPPGDGTRTSRPTRRGGRQALVRVCVYGRLGLDETGPV